jgi:murein DD-endopeptidase MepM/ murein hydrolase activator NlpD
MAAIVSGVCLFTFHGGGFGYGAERYSTNRINRSFRHASYEDYLPEQRLSHASRSVNINTGSRDIPPASNKSILNSKKTRKKQNAHIIHIVRKGENLTRIARRYGITVSTIIRHNPIPNANSVKTGARIIIPANNISNYPAIQKSVEKKSHTQPRFKWPVHTVIRCRQDGLDGVKPIGIIITGTPGATVFSSAGGIVRKVGHMRGFGQYIVIGHTQRYTTVYANLGKIDVKEGEQINAGIPIGRIGSGNRELHFQIDHEGKPENPLNYLPKNKKNF